MRWIINFVLWVMAIAATAIGFATSLTSGENWVLPVYVAGIVVIVAGSVFLEKLRER